MCENLKYWMKLYMARIAKGGLIVFAVSFLFFQCSNKSPSPSGPNDPGGPGNPGGPGDTGNNGLIKIKNATMLNNIRYNLAGTSYKTSANDAGNTDGCPASGCNGYELTANIDLVSLLDTNGDGVIDTGTDKSWVPIGDNSTNDDKSRFTGIFEGNNYTIANLWVNLSSPNAVAAGLFGVTGGAATIRNVGVTSGSIQSSSSTTAPAPANSASGGLVGFASANSSLTITNSYFSGSAFAVSSSAVSTSSTARSAVSASGGLVGISRGSLTITNCIFSGSGDVSSSSSASAPPSSAPPSSISISGGLVGGALSGSLTITNSYFSGSGGVASSSAPAPPSSISISGGLVGGVFSGSLTITNSYFSGSSDVSSGVLSGGLVGNSPPGTFTIMNGYWNTDTSQMVGGNPQNPKRAEGNAGMSNGQLVDAPGTTGLTLTQLTATSGTIGGLPHSATDAWDLGNNMQLPAVKLCVPKMTNGVADWTMCASYGAFLPGQGR